MNTVMKQIHNFDGGLTVKDLKAFIADWAEVDEMGNPTQVWIETAWGTSSPVLEVAPLDTGNVIPNLYLVSGEYQMELNPNES